MRGRHAPSSAWPRQRGFLAAAVLANAVVALAIVAADADVALRPFVVFAFLVIGPGLAVTGFLDLREAGTELAVAVPLSLAIDAVVAGALSLADQWRPTTALVASAAAASAALALQLWRNPTGVGR